MVPINVSYHDLQENHFSNIELDNVVVTTVFNKRACSLSFFGIFCHHAFLDEMKIHFFTYNAELFYITY